MVNFKSTFLNFFKSTPDKVPESLDQQEIVMAASGTSGTEIYSGYFDEEYLQKLQAERGIKVFDEMRRSDGQVKMLLSSVKNPIKSAVWDIEPAGTEKIDLEIADFAKYVLFKKMGSDDGTKRRTFKEFIAESLTMIEFGFVAFEIVHKLVKNDKTYGDFIGISELGFRHQRSILEWYLNENGSIKAIRQNVNGDLGTDTFIAGQHLLVISVEKEGDNYEGISMLRPCYGAWFRKNIYRKLQAIGIERCAKGVVAGTISMEARTGMSDTKYNEEVIKFQRLIDKLSAHEKNGIVLGAGFDIKEIKISHDSEKVQSVIDSENIEMSKAFLANFMELGLQGNSGSFALGTDLSDLFLNGIQYIGEMICENVNLQVIETIVKAKYGEQENYPKLKVTGINDKAGKELAEIVVSLLGQDALQKSTTLQRHLHKLYKLPDLDEEIEKKDDERFLDNTISPPSPADSEQLSEKKNCCDEKPKVYQLSDTDRGKFPISADIEDAAGDLEQFMSKSLKSRAAEMLDQMETLILNGGDGVANAVLNITMPKSKSYQTALENWAETIVEDAYNQVVNEVNESENNRLDDKRRKAPKKLNRKMVTLVNLAATYQDADIEKIVYFSFNAVVDNAPPEVVVREMKAAVTRYFEKGSIETTAVNMASSIVNSTRRATFLSPEVAPQVESFVFVNPDPVSPICKALNGKVFSKEEFETSTLTPPLHHNCKSYIRAQTAGKAGNLPITGLKVSGSKEEVDKIMRSKTL